MDSNSNGPAPFVPQKTPLWPSQMTGAQFEKQFPIPEEFLRSSSGSTIVEPDSVMDENGRVYFPLLTSF